MFRKKDLDARAGGLRRFDEDEFVFVGQDHWDRAGNLLMRTVFGKLPKTMASAWRLPSATDWQPLCFPESRERLLRSLRECFETPTGSQLVK